MRTLLFLILFLVVISCNNIKQITSLEGNWYSCSKRGDYIEFIVKNDSYRYSSNLGIVTPWFKYKINKDTLFQYDTNKVYDSMVIKKSIISFSKNGKLFMNYITSNENWIMFRIDEDISNIQDDDLLLKGTKERSKKINCQDIRRKEEKIQDSINSIIDFRF